MCVASFPKVDPGRTESQLPSEVTYSLSRFIGFPLSLLFSSLFHSVSWDPLPNKLPAPKSMTQNLLWGTQVSQGLSTKPGI